eukprot:3498193-Rhodomonas_salina.2
MDVKSIPPSILKNSVNGETLERTKATNSSGNTESSTGYPGIPHRGPGYPAELARRCARYPGRNSSPGTLLVFSTRVHVPSSGKQATIAILSV